MEPLAGEEGKELPGKSRWGNTRVQTGSKRQPDPELPPAPGAPRAGAKVAEAQGCSAGQASLPAVPLKLLRACRSPPSPAVTVSACFTFRLVSLQRESGGRMHHHPEILRAGGSRLKAAGWRVRLPTKRKGAQTLTRPVPSSQCRSGCGAHCCRARGRLPTKGKNW